MLGSLNSNRCLNPWHVRPRRYCQFPCPHLYPHRRQSQKVRHHPLHRHPNRSQNQMRRSVGRECGVLSYLPPRPLTARLVQLRHLLFLVTATVAVYRLCCANKALEAADAAASQDAEPRYRDKESTDTRERISHKHERMLKSVNVHLKFSWKPPTHLQDCDLLAQKQLLTLKVQVSSAVAMQYWVKHIVKSIMP